MEIEMEQLRSLAFLLGQPMFALDSNLASADASSSSTASWKTR